MHFLILTIFFLSALNKVSLQSAPTHCSHVEGTLFTCDYTAMTSSAYRPIDYNSFNPEPQRIDLTVDGFVPYFGDNEVFSTGFGSISIGDFDPNYPASLTMNCEGGSTMLFDGAFSNMSHVQHLTIKDCEIYTIPDRAFEDLQNLDKFTIERGSIINTDLNAWAGLNVEKLTNDVHDIPRNLGSVEILYAKFPSTTIPIGMFYNMKNLTTATLRGTGISSLSSDVFGYNTKLKMMDLSDNEFTFLPSGMFDNLNALAEVQTDKIQWQCSCDNNWFVHFFVINNITFRGDNICSNNGQTIMKYYYENCADSDVCDGIIGFAVGSKCVTVLALVIMVLAFAALAMVIIALVMIISSGKEYKEKDRKRRQAIGRWNQLIDRTIAWNKR